MSDYWLRKIFFLLVLFGVKSLKLFAVHGYCSLHLSYTANSPYNMFFLTFCHVGTLGYDLKLEKLFNKA